MECAGRGATRRSERTNRAECANRPNAESCEWGLMTESSGEWIGGGDGSASLARTSGVGVPATVEATWVLLPPATDVTSHRARGQGPTTGGLTRDVPTILQQRVRVRSPHG